MKLEYLGDKQYKVLESFTIGDITVPEGFITDIDSVPRIPFIYTIYKNRAIQASILHDYLYSTKRTRAEADRIYFQAMTTTKVKSCYKYPIYWAVKFFGWIFY